MRARFKGSYQGRDFGNISSRCVNARGFSLSNFIAIAARARVASFRIVEFAGEGLASDFTIACSKARAASSAVSRKQRRPAVEIQKPRVR